MKCMKYAVTVLFPALHYAAAQDLLVDQASGTVEEPVVNAYRMPDNQLAQSFTPSFNAVGFVQLRSLLTFPSGNTVTVAVNLRQGAYDGPVISSTDPVIIPGFADVGTFYFPDNIPVSAGQMYFFEPVLQSLGSLDVGFKDPSDYLNGNLWGNGVPSPTGDLWFREGIVVPEPSILALLGVGAGMAFMLGKHRAARMSSERRRLGEDWRLAKIGVASIHYTFGDGAEALCARAGHREWVDSRRHVFRHWYGRHGWQDFRRRLDCGEYQLGWARRKTCA